MCKATLHLFVSLLHARKGSQTICASHIAFSFCQDPHQTQMSTGARIAFRPVAGSGRAKQETGQQDTGGRETSPSFSTLSPVLAAAILNHTGKESQQRGQQHAGAMRTNVSVVLPALLCCFLSIGSVCSLERTHAATSLHTAHRIDGKLRPQHSQRSAAAADRCIGDVSLKPPRSRRQADHRPAAYQPARTPMPYNSVVMRMKELFSES